MLTKRVLLILAAILALGGSLWALKRLGVSGPC